MMFKGLIAWWFSMSAVAAPIAQGPVTLGIDRLLSEEIHLVAGKRVGLITNGSGVAGNLVSSVERAVSDKRFKLVQLYAPEHGLYGMAAAGHRVKDGVDPITKLPVQSLFGRRRGPTKESLKGVDVLLFDIQDIGSRTYTYTSTMGESMQAAKAAGVPFVVLDRPNPNGGLTFEGPILPKKRQGFLGWGPTPVSHGMTIGELARFYNKVKGIGCDLRVVKMAGWRRSMTWEDTGLKWVPTSPAVPYVRQAHLYVATGMVGGVNKSVNEGYGTTLPFELIGAKFIKPFAFAQTLNGARLEGVYFRPTWYRPTYGRYRKKSLAGVQVVLTDVKAFKPLRTAVTILTTLERLYPGQTRYKANWYFAAIWGNKKILAMIRAGRSAQEIIATWKGDEDRFRKARKPFLLYPE